MESFHVTLHPLRKSDLDPLGAESDAIDFVPAGRRFECSFEQLADRLAALPRFFLEPDGSFVWVVESNDARFQLDGLLVDDGSQMLNVEIKGTAGREVFSLFLSKLCSPEETVVVQLVERGVYLTLDDFQQRFLASENVN